MKKLIFITGGSRGIGKAVVQKFHKEGFLIAFSFLNSKKDAEKLEISGEIKSFQGDCSDEKEIKNIFEKIKKHFGKSPDFLVNNAGIVNRQKFPNLDGETFLNTLKINTVGPYLCTKEFFKNLDGDLEKKSVVFVGSLQGWLQTAKTVDYAASKGAIHNMVSSLSKAMTPIRINGVAPGFTKTDMHKGNFERLEQEAKKSILNKYSSPEEIANVIYFLISENASSITGEIIKVDNGRSYWKD